MKNPTDIPGIENAIPENAVSVYGQENALDDFPVLKAFQQYVDAEQTKARKRMVLLSIFFCSLMVVVVAIFLLLLMNISARNQALNDRMIELAMNNRLQSTGTPASVVVQSPQDSSAILTLTTKLEELQKKLEDERVKSKEEVARAAQEAAKPKKPTAQEIEIQRLNALLEVERAKNSAEAERKRQAEIEAYRRKHYPEFYARGNKEDDSGDDDIDALLKELPKTDSEGAIRYFEDDDEDEEAVPVRKPTRKSTRKTTRTPSRPAEKEYSIPVDVKGSSMNWNIPND